MDPADLISLVTPLVAAIVAYLKDSGAQKASDKAAEVLGERAGSALADAGPTVLATLRKWFAKYADTKAQRALEAIVEDPGDTDYRDKLVKETVRLAVAEPTFAQELRTLAGQATRVPPGVVDIDNYASNYGAQGIFNAPVTFERRKP